MITALLLNPCIDRTVFINGFYYGEMNRIVEVENIPSGKGTNVALALHKLGGKSGLIMFGQTGQDPIKNRLDSFGIPCEKVDVFDNIRVNTKLNNTEDNVVTEINEKGAKVTEDQIEQIIKLSIETARKSEYFVLTGSMPQGCDSSLYGEMMAKIKATVPECKLVLDTEGENFRKALKQKPFLIKPNKYELEIHCGRKLESIQEIASEGMKLHKDGVEYVIISMGAEGAIICCSKGSFYAMTPKVSVVNTVGAGDSMLAASILAINENKAPETVIKYAVAAGSAAVSCTHSELISKDIFEDLKSKVETKRIEL